jgi:SAM-dependent methyltransferase
VDFVLSEDVFEHVPAEGLQTAIAHAFRVLRPGGLAAIRPNVYSGITGGHLPEWYPHNVDQPIARRSEPWEHLRRKRYVANTFLNEVSRSTYRDLFEKRFEILAERVESPDLGRQHLTATVKEELRAYSDDDLFSNRVLWILRKPQG